MEKIPRSSENLQMPSFYNIVDRMGRIEQKLSVIEAKMDKVIDTLALKPADYKPNDLQDNLNRTYHQNKHPSKSKKKLHFLRRTRSTTKKSKDANAKTSVEMPDEAYYQAALQEQHKNLMDDLEIDGSDVIDTLLQQEVIYQSDHEFISSLSVRKDKVRYLLLKLNQYDESKCITFCESLEKSHSHLAEKLKTSLENHKEKPFPRHKCVNCSIRARVDVKTVVDDLYQARIVDSSLLQMTFNSGNKKEVWDRIFYQIKYCNTQQNACKIFLSSLEQKYKSLVEDIQAKGCTETFVSCKCLSEELPSGYETFDPGNASDISSIASSDGTIESIRRRKTFSGGVRWSLQNISPLRSLVKE